MKKPLLLFTLLCTLSITSFGQTKIDSINNLLCKKWMCQKTQEDNEPAEQTTGSDKTDYIKFLKTGIMISTEDSVPVTWHWQLNYSTMTITATQNQDDDIPPKMILKIIKLTPKDMVYTSTDPDDSTKLTLYLYPSK